MSVSRTAISYELSALITLSSCETEFSFLKIIFICLLLNINRQAWPSPLFQRSYFFHSKWDIFWRFCCLFLVCVTVDNIRLPKKKKPLLISAEKAFVCRDGRINFVDPEWEGVTNSSLRFSCLEAGFVILFRHPSPGGSDPSPPQLLNLILGNCIK